MAKKVITKKAATPSKKIVAKTPVKKVSKPVVKSAPKKSVATRTQVQAHAVKSPARRSAPEKVSTKSTEQPKPKTAPFKIRKSYVLTVIAILAVGVLLYASRSLFVAAVVNGQPISRISIIRETEKQSGKQALDTIIRNTLIEQEARKANVTVSEKEIDDEIKKVDETLSKQGQKIDDVLAMQGMTRQDLRKVIRLNKLVTKVVGSDVKVTDDEVNAYVEKNKDLLPQGQTEEQLKKTATDQVKQQKLNDKIRTWLESLQTKAKIMYFVQY
jgi:hypothetical protein